MKNGFYTALGTPFDENGNFIPHSFKMHIEDQINAGASGLLVMGSMGIEPYIRDSEYVNVVQTAVEAAKESCPVLVGVMDNSVGRVVDRINSIKGLKIDGVVATTPYYYPSTQEDIKNFYSTIANASPYPLYLYDLPPVTQTKISAGTVEQLMSVKNIRGMKTGDINTAKLLKRSPLVRDDFDIIFSGLDIFDIAYKYGIRMNLDGMFSCTPNISSKMYKSLENDDYETAGKCLESILKLRNTFVETGVFKGFTYAMNILGYEGIFSPDYMYKHDENDVEKVRECMKECGII